MMVRYTAGILAALGWVALVASSPALPSMATVQEGKVAPDFELSDLEGQKTVHLSEFRGKPVLLSFWAAWCKPCRREMPELQRLHERYGKEVVVIGINEDRDPAPARRLLREKGITYLNLWDHRGEVFAKYRIVAFPTTVWINPEGILLKISKGYAAGYIESETRKLFGLP